MTDYDDRLDLRTNLIDAYEIVNKEYLGNSLPDLL
jgi:hypothetical protein